MKLHQPFLCENCFYDTCFFQENRPTLILFIIANNEKWLSTRICAILLQTTCKRKQRSKFEIVLEKNAENTFGIDAEDLLKIKF